MKTTTNKNLLDNFMIDVQIISPLKKIVADLENKNYRECDLNWLDSRLEFFIKITAETLFLKFDSVSDTNFITLNEYVYNYYKAKFTTLLQYFENY